jgi:dimethylamine---corrinoid protein Co-methyltransferase
VGTGDPAGVAITHAMTSGMGGMRTAGDLVARMQMTRGMKLGAAKQYVAAKLGAAVQDLSDPVRMREVREDLRLGVLQSPAGFPTGIEAKHAIARLLDIELNSLKASSRRISG